MLKGDRRGVGEGKRRREINNKWVGLDSGVTLGDRVCLINWVGFRVKTVIRK